MSAAEEEFARQLDLCHVAYTREYRFNPDRRWRADFFLEPSLLIEIEGGVYANGRHTRGEGYEKDCEKYNAAILAGYKLLRFTPRMVESGYALETVLGAVIE